METSHLGFNRWLVTGAAGFIGSHLTRELLLHDQEVVGLDDLSTGSRKRFDLIRQSVGEARFRNFRFIEGSILDDKAVGNALDGIDYVLHQAARTSVPLSLQNPELTHQTNVTGTSCLLNHARLAKVKRVVFASSSAVYGEGAPLPSREGQEGNLLSPYAASKKMNEIEAATFANAYGFSSVGLRYFNVFGVWIDPQSPYASVIPLWIRRLVRQEDLLIFGDGNATRDFCSVDLVVAANIQLARHGNLPAFSIYNVGSGQSTRVLDMANLLIRLFGEITGEKPASKVVFAQKRSGDIQDSLASTERLRSVLGDSLQNEMEKGLRDMILEQLQVAK